MMKRIISGSLFLGGLVAMYLFSPTWGLVLMLLVMCALAVLETVSLLEHAGYPVLKWTSLGIGLSWMLAAWFVESQDGQLASLHLIMPGISAWVIFLGCLFRSDQSKSLEKLAGSFMTVAYIPGLMQFLILLLFLGSGERDARSLALYGVLVIKSTDMGAYFIGSAIGKRKLIPKISPGKSWEGVIGGVCVAILVSVIAMALYGFELSGIQFRWWDGVILGLLLSVAGVLGDLVESMIKRASDCKDSGHWISGMGGMLDVLDSLLFAIPVLYIYVIVFLV